MNIQMKTYKTAAIQREGIRLNNNMSSTIKVFNVLLNIALCIGFIKEVTVIA